MKFFFWQNMMGFLNSWWFSHAPHNSIFSDPKILNLAVLQPFNLWCWIYEALLRYFISAKHTCHECYKSWEFKPSFAISSFDHHKKWKKEKKNQSPPLLVVKRHLVNSLCNIFIKMDHFRQIESKVSCEAIIRVSLLWVQWVQFHPWF